MTTDRRRALAVAGLIGGGLLLLGPGTGRAIDVGIHVQAIAISVQEVDLRWTPTGPAEGCATTVWRDGAALAVLCGAGGEFLDTSVLPGTRYRYQVVSAPVGAGPSLSNEVTLTTPSLPDGVDVNPPSPPTDLQGLAGDAGVSLSWQSASDDTDISAYEVRRDGVLIAFVDAATLDYLETPLPAGSEATYSVTALDVLGQASRPTVVVVDVAGPVPPTSGGPVSSAAATQEPAKEAP